MALEKEMLELNFFLDYPILCQTILLNKKTEAEGCLKVISKFGLKSVNFILFLNAHFH